MARRPAARPTPGETRSTARRDNREASSEASSEANSANVRNPTTGARTSPEPDVNDALRFMGLVRTKLGNEVYNAFSALLRDYRQNRLPLTMVVRRVTALLEDDRDLIVGFNRYLPSTDRIHVPVQNLRRVRIFAPAGDAEQ